MSPPLKPSFVEATETSIVVEVSSVGTLQWKPHPATWDTCQSQIISTPTKLTLEPLEPGTTYCIRILSSSSSASNTNEEVSPELIVDTEQVGCTPQTKQGCACVIQ